MMIRYFFDVVYDGGEHLDLKGQRFSDVKAAKAHAAMIARLLTQEGDNYAGCSVCITDEGGHELHRVFVEEPTTIN